MLVVCGVVLPIVVFAVFGMFFGVLVVVFAVFMFVLFCRILQQPFHHPLVV